MRLDYSAPTFRRRPSWAGFRTPLLAAAAVSFVVFLVTRPGDAYKHEAIPLPQTLSAEVEGLMSEAPMGVIETHVAAPLEPIDQFEEAPAEDWETVTVRSGQSLSGIFDSLGLPAADWLELSRMNGDAERLRRLRVGDEITLRRSGDRLSELRLPLDEVRTLQIIRNEGGFEPLVLTAEVERRPAYAFGEINSSLFLAGKSAGLSDRLIMELVSVFGYDVDFALDIRSGDRFIVIYEELYRDGEKLRDGDILAAEFINRGRTIHAVRHVSDDGHAGYFKPDGDALRTAFLRNPLDIFRISSHFNPNRRHPVLNTLRAHRGTDYAAPTGTPIRATGDGRVIHAGPRGGYGTTVMIRHGATYETLYAHMSRIRPGIRNGSRVRQGQVIGYVGMTGLATGPHLHYEFLVNGVHRNPVTVPLPRSNPVAANEKSRFLENSNRLLAQIETLHRTHLARQGDKEG
jgi:murein DD-endopeptidase MepM/ murein hydrolase activator NlpD